MSIDAFLEENARKDLLRFSTAGSVDDGKSTLIGRLLHDSRLVYEDHLATLRRDSERRGFDGGEFDYALLLDGLRAEREQNITIDVAYRYFSTPRRTFIIADTPGHEQYTRNMVTGASTADLAVILIDAAKGMQTQSRRHSFIMSLLNVRHLVVAVNKMDLVEYSEEVFERIRSDFTEFAAKLDIHDVHFIPMSALRGDNIVGPGDSMPWYTGAPLLSYLETVHIVSDHNYVDFRFPVQYVLRPDRTFRGYCGTVVSGTVRPGQEILALPSGRRTRVRSILTGDGEVDEGFPPRAVTITTEDELDISRGDMLVHVHNLPRVSPRFEAMIVWMDDTPLAVGREYIIKHTTSLVSGHVSGLRYIIDVNTLHRGQTDTLGLNDIGRAEVTLTRPLLHDTYERNRSTGSFIMIDPVTDLTVGAGMIIDRPTNEQVVGHRVDDDAVPHPPLHSHGSRVTAGERAGRFGHRSAAVWFTGLPRSGKSTLSFLLERRLFDLGHTPYVLDGENMRLSISRDLGFTADDRAENIRRASDVASFFCDAGLIVVAGFVSPYEEDREHARAVIGPDRFLEVWLTAPDDVLEARDADDLYSAARRGDIPNFTGVSAPYEPPAHPDIVIRTDECTPDEAVDTVMAELKRRGIIP